MEDDEDSSSTTTISSMFKFLLLLLVSISVSPVAAQPNDASVMVKLSRSLIQPPLDWSNPDPCKWQGITCNNMGQVTSINIASKFISGTLPLELSSLSALETLSLQNNHLTGTIPSLSNMPSLREIFLDRNSFTNISSPFLSRLSSLQSFSIDDNPLFPWSLPSSLSDSSSLQSFHAANASVFGPIPDIFANLSNLQDLRLSYNSLTGSLPLSLSETSLQNIWINNQKQGLSGTLDVLGAITGLTQVWVQDNNFVGPIPDLSNCASLFDLQLRDNHLTGVIPPSLMALPKLVNVSLQNNMFQGPVPVFNRGVQVNLGNSNSFCSPNPGPCDPQVSALLDIVGSVGYPEEMTRSWQGNDACKNWNYITCDSSGKVTAINFTKRNWTGLISPTFANLTSLTSIILSDNHFVGTIPDSLTSLKMLQKLDLSNNNLTGNVPKFSKSVMVKTDGNPFIGTNVDTTSSVILPPGVRKSHYGTKSSSTSRKSRLSGGAIVAIVLCSLLILIIIGFFVYKYVFRKKFFGKNGHNKGMGLLDKPGMSPMELPLGTPSQQQSHNLNTTYDHGNSIAIEVLREVTNDFDNKNILGKGGFGVVYKGMFQDGACIAVKRMVSNLQGTKGMAEFEAEISVLSKVRHRHLVAFLGYCVNGNERIVVYEYMPQGTLGQRLFDYQKLGLAPLGWKQRMVIALDVARGVEYLHSLAQQSFIHRDLKTSNILLGDDMRAKVADFGLVRNAPGQGKYSVETKLAGTFGYLAPEYAATGRVTTKVDVFAYGVVLMELITGRKALDESLPDDEAQLVTWFRRVLVAKDSLRKAVDPNLEVENEEIFDSICKVAELSGYCTAREPHQRPDMSHIVNNLSPLVELWKPTEATSEGDYGVETDISLTQALQRWQAGETSTMSGYSQIYNSSTAPTTPGMNDSFHDIHGR